MRGRLEELGRDLAGAEEQVSRLVIAREEAMRGTTQGKYALGA